MKEEEPTPKKKILSAEVIIFTHFRMSAAATSCFRSRMERAVDAITFSITDSTGVARLDLAVDGFHALPGDFLGDLDAEDLVRVEIQLPEEPHDRGFAGVALRGQPADGEEDHFGRVGQDVVRDDLLDGGEGVVLRADGGQDSGSHLLRLPFVARGTSGVVVKQLYREAVCRSETTMIWVPDRKCQRIFRAGSRVGRSGNGRRTLRRALWERPTCDIPMRR